MVTRQPQTMGIDGWAHYTWWVWPQRSLWQQTPAPLLLLFKLILHLEKGQLGQVFRNDLLVLT